MNVWIKKIKIQGFKCFDQPFSLELKEKINIIVGNNDEGKSTILEALHLILTGYIQGKPMATALSQYLFSAPLVRRYLDSVNAGKPIQPPQIHIEVFFSPTDDTDTAEYALFKGDGNSEKVDASGVSLTVGIAENLRAEYEMLVQKHDLHSLPIEYYTARWKSFARKEITPRFIPIKTSLVDSSTYSYSNGSDVYVSRILQNALTDENAIGVAQAYRKMLEQFGKDESIERINNDFKAIITDRDKKVRLAVDLGTKSAWGNSLTAELDEIPFAHIGKGTQCIAKTELALSSKKAKKSSIILIEEPESHLAFANLNKFISRLADEQADKQLILTTHSSFVANKLGLDNLYLLNAGKVIPLSTIAPDTKAYFQKIDGYDTLRFLLCSKAILCEGASDELIIQKAYMMKHGGRLPIQEGIDVISVGTSFLRYLELARILHKPTVVVTDNDGDLEAVKKKYNGFDDLDFIRICYEKAVTSGKMENYNYNTLEPEILKANGLEKINSILGTNYECEDSLLKHMTRNKTECALRFFQTTETFRMPQYIMEAIV